MYIGGGGGSAVFLTSCSRSVLMPVISTFETCVLGGDCGGGGDGWKVVARWCVGGAGRVGRRCLLCGGAWCVCHGLGIAT